MIDEGKSYKLDTVSLRTTDNLQKSWTMTTKLAVLDKIEELRKQLIKACNRLDDGSAWADDEEGEFQEMCEVAEYKRVEDD